MAGNADVWVAGSTTEIVTAVTTNLANMGNAINTSVAKVAGYQVWNTTLNRPVWAVGDSAVSLWVFSDGTTAHTPI